MKKETTLPAPFRQKLSRIVEVRGTLDTARALNISRGVIERSVGGLPCRAGSIALLSQALASFEKGQ